MGVCFITGGKSQYSGLCVFGAQDVKATISAYASLRVKSVVSVQNYTFWVIEPYRSTASTPFECDL